MRFERCVRYARTHVCVRKRVSLSPTMCASLLIHPLQLSGWFYHPVSCRKITSDKLGWLNRLGKLADPALPPCMPLSVLTLYGWRAQSAKITVLREMKLEEPKIELVHWLTQSCFVEYRKLTLLIAVLSKQTSCVDESSKDFSIQRSSLRDFRRLNWSDWDTLFRQIESSHLRQPIISFWVNRG